MRVVVMGTPQFAVPTLEALARVHEVVAVYSRPDAVSGRGSRTRPSPVSSLALELGLALRTPATLRDSEEPSALRALAPDVVVVVAFGLILPPDVLDIPPLGCINVHASLLPRWRGAAPIQRAILAGDERSGVSIMRMEEGLDTGPYCAAVSIPVADKGADTLTRELAALGADLLIETLPAIASGTARWTQQDEAEVTYADKVVREDVTLHPGLSTLDALRRVRASGETAPSRIRVAGRGVTLIRCEPTGSGLAPGSAAAHTDGLALGLSDGSVVAARIKPDGRTEMDASQWLCGARLDADSTWEGWS